VRWLVCELVAVYFLFAVGAIGGPTKRATLEAIDDPEQRHTLLDDPWALRDFADDAAEGIAVRELRLLLP
jgi:hypothetical protein